MKQIYHERGSKMKQIYRDALRKAALDGVTQVFGVMATDENGKQGLCAMGVLMIQDSDTLFLDLGVRAGTINCPLSCGYLEQSRLNVLVHLNDFHRLDFLAIAEKMPPEDV